MLIKNLSTGFEALLTQGGSASDRLDNKPCSSERGLPPSIILYAVHLVFEGLNLRAAARALAPLIRRSHVALWR